MATMRPRAAFTPAVRNAAKLFRPGSAAKRKPGRILQRDSASPARNFASCGMITSIAGAPCCRASASRHRTKCASPPRTIRITESSGAVSGAVNPISRDNSPQAGQNKRNQRPGKTASPRTESLASRRKPVPISRPELPGMFAAFPHLIERLRLFEGVHGIPESVVRIQGQLSRRGKAFEWSALENTVLIEPVKDRAVEDEVPAGRAVVHQRLFLPVVHDAVAVHFHDAVPRASVKPGERGDLFLLLVKRQQGVEVDVAQPIAIVGEKKFLLNVVTNTVKPPAGLCLGAGIDEGDLPVLHLVRVIPRVLRARTQPQCEIVLHGLIIEEIIFDHRALV